MLKALAAFARKNEQSDTDSYRIM